jgi:hypothetical protein
MTTFYDQDGIRITERWLWIGDQRYPLDQLANLRRARGPTDPTARWAACIAALSVPGLVVIGPLIPPLTVLIIIGTLVAAPAALAALRFRLRPAAYLLWADYYGFPMLLYQTTDDIKFGKISRALVRASTHISTPP